MKRALEVKRARELFDRMCEIVGDEFTKRASSTTIEITQEQLDAYDSLDALEECELLAGTLDDMDDGLDISEAMAKRLDAVAKEAAEYSALN